MANTIKLRRSAVSGAVPTTSQLALGEVAINTFDGKLFIKKDDGTASIVEIGAGGGGGGAGSAVSTTAPTSPSNGDFWYNLNTGTQLIYVDDGNSQQWVDVSSAGSGSGGADVSINSSPPSQPSHGDLWYDTDTAAFYLYIDDGDTQQWAEIGRPGATGGTGSSAFSTSTVNTFTKAQVFQIVALTDAANISMDASLGNNFSIVLGGNRVFDNPTNMAAGQSGSIFIDQDATGNRSLTWGNYWKFPGGVAPTLTSAANAQNRIDYIIKSSTVIQATFAGSFS